MNKLHNQIELKRCDVNLFFAQFNLGSVAADFYPFVVVVVVAAVAAVVVAVGAAAACSGINKTKHKGQHL